MISFHLTDELEQQLNCFSEQQKVSKSQVIKDALIIYFNLQKQQQENLSAYQLGKNLFGRFSSQEESLSSSYKQRIKGKISAKNSNR